MTNRYKSELFIPKFGWIEPSNEKKHLHTLNYSWRVYMPIVAKSVEVINKLPSQYTEWYNQGTRRACVGAATAQLMAMMNLKQIGPMHYDWWKHYCQACLIDQNDQTTCERDIGTYEWAGLDVLRLYGAYIFGGNWDLTHGIQGFRWIKSADDARTAIAEGQLVGAGTPWPIEFSQDRLKEKDKKLWVPPHREWTTMLGGHSYGYYDALDSVDGFGFANTWGRNYPDKVYIHYEDAEYLMTNFGSEFAALIDREFTPPPPPPEEETHILNVIMRKSDGSQWVGTADLERSR